MPITLLNRDAYHGIRVRYYERDLPATRLPLCDVLEPIEVNLAVGEVEQIAVTEGRVILRDGSDFPYDRLLFAAGSQLARPPLPGLAEHSFNIDTYAQAERLAQHLATRTLRLPSTAVDETGYWSAAVIGAGLTGIEAACELIDRLREQAGQVGTDLSHVRVTLFDHSPHVGSNMGEEARPFIEEATRELGITLSMGVRVKAITPTSIEREDGVSIPSQTTIWTAGMRASPLASQIARPCDPLGRIQVDEQLRVAGQERVFAAGDVASLRVDAEHDSVMSCQHARPMGRFAGHNAVADLAGTPLLSLSIPNYVTILDLGSYGALYTEGWERRVAIAGPAAKSIKQTINCQRIYPPTHRDREAIFAAAEPVVQIPPSKLPAGEGVAADGANSAAN